jgi:hypothetical protein
MDLTEIGWGGTDWIHLAHDRGQSKTLVNMLTNLWAPKILEILV